MQRQVVKTNNLDRKLYVQYVHMCYIVNAIHLISISYSGDQLQTCNARLWIIKYFIKLRNNRRRKTPEIFYLVKFMLIFGLLS